MATLTQRLGLRKAAGTDNVDVVADIDNNLDLIDAEFAKIVGRNKIRNGDMGIAQRGNGPYALNAHGIDGWRVDGSGGSVAHQRNTLALGTLGTVSEAKYTLQTTISGQAAAGDYGQTYCKIEGVQSYAGKQVTLSFVAFATSGVPKIGIEIQQIFGTGGAPSATVNTTVQAVQVSTVGTRYTVTFNVPGISGKTLGTNNDDYLLIGFWLSAGTTFAARSSNIGIQNNTFHITDVQLEEGAYATKFERLPQQMQLAWCQRYFERLDFSVASAAVGAGMMWSNIEAHTPIRWITPKRANPTIQGAGAMEHVTAGASYGPTGTSYSAICKVSADMVTTISGATPGQGMVTRTTAAGTLYFDISAEL